MEVTTICRKGSTYAKLGVMLWTLEIFEKRISHELLAPGSRRNRTALKNMAEPETSFGPLSPMSIGNLRRVVEGRYTEVSHIPNSKSMQPSERPQHAGSLYPRASQPEPAVGVSLR